MGSGQSEQIRNPPSLSPDNPESKTLTLADALTLGSHFEYLRSVKDNGMGTTVGEASRTLAEIHSVLSSRDIDSLVEDQIQDYAFTLEEVEDKARELNDDEISTLVQNSTTWKHLLFQELKREKRIPVSGSGMLNVRKLSDNPAKLFEPGVWEWLENRPRSDIEEACKTIVVGCYTSSVMISLRAVEHCLRKWYEEENESLDAAWGRVLDQLMEEYTDDDKKNDTVLTQLSDLPPVLSNLYYLKEKRNEVNYPDKSPSAHEARQTLIIVSSTITEIYYELGGHESPNSLIEDIDFEDIEDEYSSENVDEEELLWSVIRGLDVGNGANRGLVVKVFEDLGYPPEETEDMIQDLLMAGQAYEPDDTHLRPI